MTIYLIDANVLIRAHGDYYPIDRLKPFWEWLTAQGQAGRVKMPREIYDEVAKSSDLLGQWLRIPEVKKAIIFLENTNVTNLSAVLEVGYGPDLNDLELEKIGRDPFLIASAMGGAERIVVTREVSKPKAQRGNRKVPDVCVTMGVTCINDFELWRRLAFRID